MFLLLAREGFAEVVLVLVAIVVVAGSIGERARDGRKGKYHAAIGNALMQVEPIFRPSRQHIIEARQYEEVEKDGDGDPPSADGCP